MLDLSYIVPCSEVVCLGCPLSCLTSKFQPHATPCAPGREEGTDSSPSSDQPLTRVQLEDRLRLLYGHHLFAIGEGGSITHHISFVPKDVQANKLPQCRAGATRDASVRHTVPIV